MLVDNHGSSKIGDDNNEVAQPGTFAPSQPDAAYITQPNGFGSNFAPPTQFGVSTPDVLNASPWMPASATWPCPNPDQVVPPGGCSESTAPTIDELINEHINAIPPTCSPGELEQRIRTLVQVLVERRCSALINDTCFEKLKAKIKELKLGNINKKTWKQYLNEAAATAAFNTTNPVEAGNNSVVVRVKDTIPDAPVPDDAAVPDGFQLTNKGVYQIRADRNELIVTTPVVISERLIYTGDGTEAVELAWFRDGRWVMQICDRRQIAISRELVELSNAGLPVDAENVHKLISYLSAFEAKNLGLLPRKQVRRQFGWTGPDMSSFLWGHTYIGAKNNDEGCQVTGPLNPFLNTLPSFDDDSDGGSADDSAMTNQPIGDQVLFQGADVGDEQAARGYRADGTLDGWKAVVKPALEHPRFRLVVLSSLAASILPMFKGGGAQNFTVDVCGETSKGKTTTLRAAASVWGYADENSDSSTLSNFNSTRVGFERRVGLVNGLPIIKDDTKLVKKTEEISQLIYDVTSGRTRDRGTTKGLDRSTAFTTVLIISGESRATSMSDDGGTKARVLTLWGMPFDKADEATARLVGDLNAGILQHYGHAGPAFIRFLIDNRSRWPEWKQRYDQIKKSNLEKAQGNSVVCRLADAFSLITLTAEIAAEALNLPEIGIDPIAELWSSLTAEAAEADRATQAMWHVWNWMWSNRDDFYDRKKAPDKMRQPTKGWAGTKVTITTAEGDEELNCFVLTRLKEILQEGGFFYDATVSTWRDRGWLHVDKSDKAGLHHQVTLNGHKPRVIAIRPRGFQETGCIEKNSCDAANRLLQTSESFLQMARQLARAEMHLAERHRILAIVDECLRLIANPVPLGRSQKGASPPNDSQVRLGAGSAMLASSMQ